MKAAKIWTSECNPKLRSTPADRSFSGTIFLTQAKFSFFSLSFFSVLATERRDYSLDTPVACFISTRQEQLWFSLQLLCSHEFRTRAHINGPKISHGFFQTKGYNKSPSLAMASLSKKKEAGWPTFIVYPHEGKEFPKQARWIKPWGKASVMLPVISLPYYLPMHKASVLSPFRNWQTGK